MPAGELFRGAEAVWAVWALSVLVLLRAAAGVVGRVRWVSPRRLAGDEAGLSYTLSYVLAIPVYLFFLCLAYEATFLLIAKAGTMYAAHAGARAAVVWDSADPEDLREERVGQAVVSAMAPFATSSPEHIAAAGGPPAGAFAQAAEYALAHRAYLAGWEERTAPKRRPYRQGRAEPDALARFYLCAAARTRYEYTAEEGANGRLTLTVTYDAPLRIPGPARWLDPDGGWPFDFPIRSRAAMPHEAPDTPDRTVGIPYRSAGR